MNMLLGGGLLGGGIGGEFGKLTGEEKEQTTTQEGEDPEVAQARQEVEERRKEKHRKMEEEREKMRQDIRDKRKVTGVPYSVEEDFTAGRVGALNRKTPEELAAEMNMEDDDSLSAQFNAMVDKAKTTVSGISDTVKNLLPFGK